MQSKTYVTFILVLKCLFVFLKSLVNVGVK